MVPVSGAARDEVTRAFTAWRDASGDARAFLVDLGRFDFATADGVHPTAAGHRAIAERAAPFFEAILGAPAAD